MIEDYIIFHKYIRELVYDAPTPEEMFLEEGSENSNLANEIKLSVEYLKDSGLFHVDLHINLKATMPSGTIIFTLNLIYRGLVSVNFSMSEDMIRECLNARVPQELYGYARFAVESITKVSGFPPVKMEQVSFLKQGISPKLKRKN